MWKTILTNLAAFTAGIVLGGFYFWLLWRSVRTLSAKPDRSHTLLLGYLLRLGIVLAGFYLVMWGDWMRLVSALIGFMTVRGVLVRRWGAVKRGNITEIRSGLWK